MTPRATSCQVCGETRVERDTVAACLGCGELTWPGGKLYFGLYRGGSQRLELLVALMRRQSWVNYRRLCATLWGNKAAADLPTDPGRALRVQIHGTRRLMREAG